MEVRARYTLMGLFTLAVICAGFAFVYWLNAIGGLGERASYRVRFDGPVAGLLKGSPVLFNGIRVGEVTAMSLEAARPRDVIVEIAIDRAAPLRADTVIGIDFQGLTGAPVVTLAGGSAELPLLASLKEPPVLVAQKNAGVSMTQAARDVLRHVDAVVTDNAEPLRGTIAGLNKFTDALARNADKVDGILAGLERLTGARKVSPRVYDLAAAESFPGLKARPQALLLIADPTALAVLENDKIQVKGGDPSTLDNAQWPDILSKVVQARIVESFENAQYTRVLARTPDNTQSDFQLLIDVRRLQIVAGTPIRAEVELAAKIVRNGTITDMRVFRAAMPADALESPVAAAALSRAFQAVASELVVWGCAAIESARP